MSTPKISVVMTTYNGMKYIIEQLESIRLQSIPPDEVLIFDDCSSDDTPIIVREYISNNRLTNWHFFINERNLGWKKNFYQGLKRVNGEFIFLSDQDDVWDNMKIEKMVDSFNLNSNISLLCCNYTLKSENHIDIGKRIRQKIKNDGELKKVLFSPKFHLVGRPGCTYCIKKGFLEKVLECWVDDYAHDKLLWNAAILDQSLFCLNSPLVIFRRHENNASSKGPTLERNERMKNHMTDIDVFNKLVKTIDLDFNHKQAKTLCRYKKWLDLRLSFFEKSTLLKTLKLFAYIDFYSSIKSFFADLLSRNRK